MKEQINGINGNEVSLEDILKMAKEITESISKKEQDNMEQFKRIVEGVAADKAAGGFSITCIAFLNCK